MLDLSSMLSMDDRVIMESTGPYCMNLYNKLEDTHIQGDQKAMIATANKMPKIIWFMLTRREAYESANRKRCIKKLNKMGG
jgi:hypothetical protein